MMNQYDYKQYKVLFVDDEAKACKYFTRAFEEDFNIITCNNGIQALEEFQKHQDQIAIIVTDQRMPEMTGVELLDKTYQLSPNVIRILSTAYADISAAVDAVNKGQIYKYVTKPWDIGEMEANLRRGMEYFLLKKERDDLMKSKLSSLERMICLSRVISMTLAPHFSGTASKNLNASVFNFLKLGYLIFDKLDLGYKNIFEINKSDIGFYETFKKHNIQRLQSLATLEIPQQTITEALENITELVGGTLSEDQTQIKDFDFSKLNTIFQGVFGFNSKPIEWRRAQSMFKEVLYLGEQDKAIYYKKETKSLYIDAIKKEENQIELFLDDELFLATIVGAL